MAMDFLPVQASAVPCERVFSSSSETDTKKRNRISPLLMESLQMLKYHYKKQRLDFSQNSVVSLWDVMDNPEEPAQADRTTLNDLEDTRDAIDKIIEAVEREEVAYDELL